MRYEFKGVELRTENAAKSYAQRSRWLVDQISQIPSNALVLDYGCGKFRYTIPLSRRVRHVCAVDSACQIDRKQQIANKRMDLRDYARKYLKNVSVHKIQSNGWRRRRFDFILCANVLSVIPYKSDRLTVLHDLRRVLKNNGQLLATTQFRNTHFKQWKKDSNAIWAKDGWFVKCLRGGSFYAIIPPDELGQLCHAAGLVVSRIGSKGETAFVFTERPG